VEGGSSSLADGRVELALGQAWGVDLQGSAGIASGDRPFALGGVDTGLVAPAGRWDVLAEPAFAPGSALGTQHVSGQVELLTPWIGIFGAHHQLGDVGATVAGLRIDTSIARQPLVKLPGFDITFGLGIRLLDPSRGWVARPGLDDVAAWGSVIWRL
jgi:hypothetical protein